MPDVIGLCQRPLVCVRMPLEAEQEIEMLPERVVDDEEGIIDRAIPCLGHRRLGAAPAEGAAVRAEHGGGHLEALVAADAVEGVLVAAALAAEHVLGPAADFDRGMAADKTVLLFFQLLLLDDVEHGCRKGNRGIYGLCLVSYFELSGKDLYTDSGGAAAATRHITGHGSFRNLYKTRMFRGRYAQSSDDTCLFPAHSLCSCRGRRRGRGRKWRQFRRRRKQHLAIRHFAILLCCRAYHLLPLSEQCSGDG